MPDLHIGQYGADLINWLVGHWAAFFDFISMVLTHLLRWVYVGIATLSPPAMVAIFAVIALLVTRRIVVTCVVTVGLLLVIDMGMWDQMLQTMAMVIVAAVLALVVGIPFGVWSAFSSVVSSLVKPVLDFMQTLPVFVYLIPTVLFFGIGVVPGTVATTVFAIPPAVRLTQLGIRQVDADTVEAANAFGASKWQVLREVQLPLAMPSIMTGVNQVIMLALSMVVVAGLVGAGGLGTVVVTAMQSLNIASAIKSGLAVVFLAIYLDRVTAAAGQGGGVLSLQRFRQWRSRAAVKKLGREAPAGDQEVTEAVPDTAGDPPVATAVASSVDPASAQESRS